MKLKERYERTIRVFLSKQVGSIRARTRHPGPHDPKSGSRLNFDIDNDYVVDLWEKQQGKCAITDLPMVHKFNQLNSVSIDRIDSSKGHVRGNIQLICQAVNLMKNSRSNSAVRSILDAYFLRRLEDYERTSSVLNKLEHS